MDVATPLIFVSIFILASISLFLVYKYGIKKKSYEEVLAEQRRQTSALLGPSKPTKLKEKKINKKAAKKLNKEKASLQEVSSVDSAPEEGKIGRKLSKVEFQEEPEEVPPVEKVLVKEVVNKKRLKKVKPILVKTTPDEKLGVSNAESAPIENHFEDSHPKDEFEMLRAITQEEVTVTSEASREEKKAAKRNKQAKVVDSAQKPPEPVPSVEEPAVPEKVAPEISTLPQVPDSVIAKERRKKKNESNSRTQLTFDRDQLIHSVRGAELSRTEVQLLIDLLLNKQLEAPAVIGDWSEGKSDPMQKLKKQLADKEKQLSDEQETLAAVQAKLREVRTERATERAQFQQKLRASEESKLDVVAAHHRLQQKVQELEEARNKDAGNFQRLVEENGALQMQRGQLEATLIGFQETDALIHALKAENLHLSKQSQLLTQQRQEQDANYQSCLLQIQNLETNHVFDLSAQQEEIRKKHEQQLHRLVENHVIEQQRLDDVVKELQSEIDRLKDETSVRVNGTKVHEVKILNLGNEVTSVRTELDSAQRALSEVREELAATLHELAEQKVKNDELRQKNWKVMEALNAAERRTNETDKRTNEMVTREQAAHKQFLQRLFPNVRVPEADSLPDWRDQFEKEVRARFDSCQPDDVAKLHNEVQHYKKIIDETEGILKKLESHIEEEERNWRSKLSEKDAEIEELKEHRTSQKPDKVGKSPDTNGIQFAYECIEKSLPPIIDELQIKVSNLESQLAQAQADNLRLLEERHSRKPPTPLAGEKDFLRLEQLNSSEAAIYQNGATSS